MDIMADMGHDEKAAADHGGDFKFTYKLADMGRFDEIWMNAFFSKNIFISIINLLTCENHFTASWSIHREPNKIKINPSTIFSMLNFEG